MDKLKYFEDLDHHFLLAYERSTEFFVMFNPKENVWVDCNITFSNFKHDYYYNELSEEEVSERTNGNLPKSELSEYVKLLHNNLGC